MVGLGWLQSTAHLHRGQGETWRAEIKFRRSRIGAEVAPKDIVVKVKLWSEREPGLIARFRVRRISSHGLWVIFGLSCPHSFDAAAG